MKINRIINNINFQPPSFSLKQKENIVKKDYFVPVQNLINSGPSQLVRNNDQEDHGLLYRIKTNPSFRSFSRWLRQDVHYNIGHMHYKTYNAKLLVSAAMSIAGILVLFII